MTTKRVTICSRHGSPHQVAAILRRLSPHCKISGPENSWTEITIATYHGLFRKKKVVRFQHDPMNYSAQAWEVQKPRMKEEIAPRLFSDKEKLIPLMIDTLQFQLSVQFEPELDLDAKDDRLFYVHSVVSNLDGVIYEPGILRDQKGRVLAAIGKDSDPKAILPRVMASVDISRTSQNETENEPEPVPPSRERVIVRALSLAAISNRALMEQDSKKRSAREAWQWNLNWVEKVGIGDELEPDEWSLLQRPLGKAQSQDVVDATWRLEGLGVLAWAIQQFKLPPYDELVVPLQLLDSVHYGDAGALSKLRDSAELRSRDELDEFLHQMFAYHWRVRNFGLDRKPMDFRKFAETAWFGPLDIGFARFANSDLALEKWPIFKAPANLLERASSIASERHLAINWLSGYSKVYSETDTST